METMSDSRRGKKTNTNKNWQSRAAWMEGKKLGRRKQIWVPETFVEHTGQPVDGHWEKV